MSRTIAIANQKGGVAKTTTAIHLAAGLAYSLDLATGKRILLVDLDPQGDATWAVLSRRVSEVDHSVYDLLKPEDLRQCTVEDVRLPTNVPGLDLLPAGRALAKTPDQLSNQPGWVWFLADALQAVAEKYEFVIVDCPPTLGKLTILGLAAADEVLVPLRPGPLELKGIGELLLTLKRTRQALRQANGRPRLGGVLMTMVEPRTLIGADTRAAIQKAFGSTVFQTEIPKSVVVAEALSRHTNLFQAYPQHKAARAYARLVKEVVTRG